MRDAGRLAIYRAIHNSDNPPPSATTTTTVPTTPVSTSPPRRRVSAPGAPASPTPTPGTKPPTAGLSSRPRASSKSIRNPRTRKRSGAAAATAELDETLFEADRRLNGYPWYDALARVNRIEFAISDNGTTHTLDSLRAPATDDAPNRARLDPDTLQRPDGILVTLHVTRADDPASEITIPAHVRVRRRRLVPHRRSSTDRYPRQHSRAPTSSRTSSTPAFFSPSDDADADSWETQRERFQDDAMHIAITLLASEEEARRISIASAVSREISWLIPRDREAHIHVIDRKITVEFTPKSQTAEPAAP